MDKHKEKLLGTIEDLKKQVHDLEKDLIHDSLTSLKTRVFFEEESNIYLSSVENANTSKRREWFGFKNISILFFDIDHFKQINDKFGHAKGDVVLREVAQTILKNVRSGDTVARWGGEEMVSLLLGADEIDAKQKAEEIRLRIEKLSFDFGLELKVTVSIGVASTNKSIVFAELIEQADKAMYKAKESGRNKVVVYSEL